MKKINYIILVIFISFLCTTFGVLLEYYYLNSKIMAEPVWGQLAKSQEDNETIEEAIVRLIAVHEGDAGAHTGAGESLETHKSQEIVDHPQGSVLPDKAGNSDFHFEVNYQSLDGFYSTAGASAGDMRLNLYVESGVYDTAYIDVIPFNTANFGNAQASLLLESVIWFDYANTATGQIQWTGLRFEIENNRVRGVSFVNASLTETTTDWYTVDMTDMHVLRAIHFVGEEKTRFYVDGILIGEISDTYGLSAEDLEFSAKCFRNTASDNTMFAMRSKISVYERQ